MLKITKVPEKVKSVFDEFRDEFTEPSFESFTQLTSAVINKHQKRHILLPSVLGWKMDTGHL